MSIILWLSRYGPVSPDFFTYGFFGFSYGTSFELLRSNTGNIIIILLHNNTLRSYQMRWNSRETPVRTHRRLYANRCPRKNWSPTVASRKTYTAQQRYYRDEPTYNRYTSNIICVIFSNAYNVIVYRRKRDSCAGRPDCMTEGWRENENLHRVRCYKYASSSEFETSWIREEISPWSV